MLFSPYFDLTDTIIALATPPGLGAIGVIRLSGPNAIGICAKAFKGKNLQDAEGHTLHFGYIFHENEIIDEVVVSVFKGPRSYTREDIVEISGHGSPFLLQRIIGLLIMHGARMAEPGEFTFRAYRNGRFDLVQAEAVADLIAADSDASRQLAMNQLRGGFSKTLGDLREQLIDLASLIELELDFGEEDVEFADRNRLIDILNNLILFVEPLIASFSIGNAIKSGVAVAIIGAPNVGKSTLLNALLNEEKAIVSNIAGTTRDVIEDTMVLGGIRYRFIDTAGIRQSADTIEVLGIDRSRKMISEASIILFVYDGNETEQQWHELEDLCSKSSATVVYVRNKADLGVKTLKNNEEIALVAKTKNGIEMLTSRLHLITENKYRTDSAITNLRHAKALAETLNALKEAKNAIEIQLTTDLLAHAIRQCLYQIGLLTGTVSNDDLLGNIFGKFCIGK